MDSRVVPSQVHENNENHPHVASQQVTHGEEEHHSENEKTSVLNKVKVKARKIRDTIKKHGQQVLDHGHESNNKDQHIPDDHELDEEKEIVEDPEVQAAPNYENEGFKSTTPASEQVENFGKSGSDFGSTTVMGEEQPHQDPVVVGVSSTAEMNQNIDTEPVKKIAGEEKPMDLERPTVLEDDHHAQGSRPEAYTLPSYETNVTVPSGAGSDEIEDIKTVEKSFERMNVHDEPKPTPEPKVLPEIADTEYPPTGSNDQFEPNLSAATETHDPSARTHDQLSSEKISTNINRNPEIEEQTFNTITTTPEEQQSVKTKSNHNSYTDEISSATADITVSPEISEASDTAEMNQNIATEPVKTFAGEEKAIDLERPIVLEDDPQGSRPEAYTLPNYQTKATDPSGAGSDEIEDIKTVEKSFGRMNVHDEPKPTPEPKVLPEIADTEYPSTGSNDQFKFEPHLSAATEIQDPSARTHDQFSSEKIFSDSNRNPEIEEQTVNTITTTAEEPQSVKTKSNHNSYTDEISSATADITVSPEISEASEIGHDEKGDRNDKVMTTLEELQKSEDVSDPSGSTAENGKSIAQPLTEKSAPVYGKVAEVGSTGGVGTETKNGVEDQNNGVALKDYLAEKLRPGEEDKALSEVISEALYKGKEEEVKKEQGNLGSEDEKSEKVCEDNSYVKSPGKGMVETVKGVVGSWFAKSEETQSPQVAGAAEDLSNDKGSGAEEEHVSQVVDERRTQE
ncbi:low-temperature-induced 65 kDa protein-like [Lotus japonicus]|uniref:low-temperature-induced 65 kDa protein-like n=1 Tax=Lotus japonicus TaxID=34305 RepID=UPI00258DB147|nr:low-temperature-induced 65 kDa protein-like [Lotus japonicus]